MLKGFDAPRRVTGDSRMSTHCPAHRARTRRFAIGPARLALIACLAVMAATAVAARQPAPQESAAAQKRLQVPVEYYKLPNGLKVVLSRDTTAPDGGRGRLLQHRLPQRAEGPHRLRAPVRAPDVPGLRRTSGRWSSSSLVEANGGVLNGSTRFDFTNYFQVVPAHVARDRAVGRGRPDGGARDRRRRT